MEYTKFVLKDIYSKLEDEITETSIKIDSLKRRIKKEEEKLQLAIYRKEDIENTLKTLK